MICTLIGSMIPNTPQEKPVANAITPDKRNNRNGRNTAGTAYFTISPERKVPASNAEIISINTHANRSALVAPATARIPSAATMTGCFP